jgi:hypothetical protein
MTPKLLCVVKPKVVATAAQIGWLSEPRIHLSRARAMRSAVCTQHLYLYRARGPGTDRRLSRIPLAAVQPPLTSVL